MQTRQQSDGQVVIQRHQVMRKLALGWLAQTNSSQQKLVELINRYWAAQGDSKFRCEHTLISRMLHPTEPYLALPGRAKPLKIQEAIMVICSGPVSASVIEVSDEPDQVWASDDEHAFLAHRARLRSLRSREGLRPYQSLAIVGELLTNALGMDDTLPTNPVGETFRQRAVENALLTLAVIIDEADVTQSLAGRMARHDGMSPARAEQVQQTQVDRVKRLIAGVKEPTVGMMAYAGVILFQCGRRDTGFGLLIEAVRRCYDVDLRHDPHWETLLDLLQRLAAQKAHDAGVFIGQSAALFDQTLDDPCREKHRQLMTRAFAMVCAPDLRHALFDHHEKCARRLFSTGPERKPARTVTGLGLLLLMSLAGLAAALAGAESVLFDRLSQDQTTEPDPIALVVSEPEPSPASDGASVPVRLSLAGASPVELNVRGREARGPNPPSSPPPPPAAGREV